MAQKIFIIGSARSGTTLMQQLLASHSDIVGVNETAILRRVDPTKQSFEQAVDIISKTPEEKDIALAHLKTQFSGESSIASITDPNAHVCPVTFLDQYCEAFRLHRKKKAYVEKTPGHAVFARTLLDEVPGSRAIIMLRDPRAVMASRLHTKRISRGNPYGMPKWFQFFLNLSELVFLYKDFQKLLDDEKYKGRIHVLSYEGLVKNSEKELRSAFAFLGMSYEPVHENIDPLDIRLKARDVSGKMNSSFGDVKKQQTISSRSVRNWDGKLSNAQIMLSQDVFARLGIPVVKKFFPDLEKSMLLAQTSFLLRLISPLDMRFFIRKNFVYHCPNYRKG